MLLIFFIFVGLQFLLEAKAIRLGRTYLCFIPLIDILFSRYFAYKLLRSLHLNGSESSDSHESLVSIAGFSRAIKCTLGESQRCSARYI